MAGQNSKCERAAAMSGLCFARRVPGQRTDRTLPSVLQALAIEDLNRPDLSLRPVGTGNAGAVQGL